MVTGASQKLTAQQSRALEFIRNSVAKFGNAPTLRELCGYMGFSAVGSAQDIVAALRKKGYLQAPTKQSARGLILSDKSTHDSDDSSDLDPNTFSIHCLGSVPAGNPLEAVEERIGTLRMSINMFSRPYPNRERLFAVKSSGQSMIGAGIFDGDWLVVLQAEEASSGDIVIARQAGDATVKRLMKDKDGWYLQPENPAFSILRASAENPFEILGKVIALQRTFRS